MTKNNLLRLIAETGYNVGFGAKTNFATLDIIEKLPGLISFVSLAVAVYSLFIPALTHNQVTALLVLIGIASLYLALYNKDRERYDEEGKRLTALFNELKNLYFEVKSEPDGEVRGELVAALRGLADRASGAAVSKQVLCSDWYAHYKFFWQMQIGWLDEQLRFRFWRDKVPLTLVAVVLGLAVVVIGYGLVFQLGVCG
jgi:hypothetical protein